MKTTIHLLLALLLISSCSKHNEVIDNAEKEPETEEIRENEDTETATQDLIKPKLKASYKEQNIFEMVTFSISIDGNDFPFMNIFTLSASYDSIVWKVINLEKTRKVFSYSSDSESNFANFTFQWGHNFFLPDEYKTCLLGYKNNAVIYSDTVSIQITDKKDFLGYNWIDITKQGDHTEGFQDALSENTEFAILKTFHNNIPGIRFFLRDTSSGKGKTLSDYITRLYSNPIYTIENTDLLRKKYQTLFNNKIENAQPQSIWITSTSTIVLLKFAPKENAFDYEIYAEPNK